MSNVSFMKKSPGDTLSMLPELPSQINSCSGEISQTLDLMLMALEALTVGGTDQIINLSQQLELDQIIVNRLQLWRLRCTNPLRRSYRRQHLKLDEAKALVIIIHNLTKKLEVQIRQRLIDAQLMQQKKLPVTAHFQLSTYLEKFREKFRNRMNSRRVKVMNYLDSEAELNQLALSLLGKLLFCSGTRGIQRFWISLFDGEIN